MCCVWGCDNQNQAGRPVCRATTHQRNWSRGDKAVPFSCTKGEKGTGEPCCAPQLPVWFLSLHEYIPRKMPTAFSNPPLPAMREKSHFSTKYHTGWSPCTTQQTRAKTGFPFFFFFFFFWAASRWLNQRQIPKHFWGRILQIWVSFASVSK